MKVLILGLLIAASVSSFASLSNAENCLDMRSTFLPICEEGKSLFFEQGTCKESHEAQFYYCSAEKMVDIREINSGTQLPYSPRAGYEQVFIEQLESFAIAKEGMASNCNQAKVLIGKDDVESAAEEIGHPYTILKFECLD